MNTFLRVTNFSSIVAGFTGSVITTTGLGSSFGMVVLATGLSSVFFTGGGAIATGFSGTTVFTGSSSGIVLCDMLRMLSIISGSLAPTV